MREIEARNLGLSSRIVSVQGDSYEGARVVHLDTTWERGFVWVGIEPHHTYRLALHELVRVS